MKFLGFSGDSGEFFFGVHDIFLDSFPLPVDSYSSFWVLSGSPGIIFSNILSFLRFPGVLVQLVGSLWHFLDPFLKFLEFVQIFWVLSGFFSRVF